MKSHQSDEFKALEKEWYQKLADSGFVDIERAGNLTQRSSNSYRQAPEVVRESKQEYYLMIANRVQEEPFESEADKIIMTKLAEGFFIEDISAELKVLGHKCHRQTIRFVIRRHEMKWGMKKYSQRQLSSRRA